MIISFYTIYVYIFYAKTNICNINLNIALDIRDNDFKSYPIYNMNILLIDIDSNFISKLTVSITVFVLWFNNGFTIKLKNRLILS